MKKQTATEPIWCEALRVGHTRIDAEHEEFAGLIQQLLHADGNALAPALDALVTHASVHFAEEDAWMQRLDFPAMHCHQREHELVLASADGVRRRLQAGETLPAGQFAAALADWFPAHVQYLDSALAQWICKHTWNAKPVVLHRHKPVAQVMSHS